MCSNERCKTCQYRAAEQDANGCDYFLITNKLRMCSVEYCDKYVKGKKIQLKTKFKAEVVQGRLRQHKQKEDY